MFNRLIGFFSVSEFSGEKLRFPQCPVVIEILPKFSFILKHPTPHSSDHLSKDQMIFFNIINRVEISSRNLRPPKNTVKFCLKQPSLRWLLFQSVVLFDVDSGIISSKMVQYRMIESVIVLVILEHTPPIVEQYIHDGSSHETTKLQ